MEFMTLILKTMKAYKLQNTSDDSQSTSNELAEISALAVVCTGMSFFLLYSIDELRCVLSIVSTSRTLVSSHK